MKKLSYMFPRPPSVTNCIINHMLELFIVEQKSLNILFFHQPYWNETILT